METQRPDSMNASTPAARNENGEFLPGSLLIYGLLGKCKVLSLESRSIQGLEQRFYKVEVQKSALSRSTRQTPAIWIPVNRASEQGLREGLQGEEAARPVFATLESREYFFDPSLPWAVLQTKLESSICREGAVGLAKALSFLHVLKRKQVVPTADTLKLYESVSKLLLRELQEATGQSQKNLESRVQKLLRHKLLPNH